MSFETTSGLGVSTFYGPRTSDGNVGAMTTMDGRAIYSLDVTGPYPAEREIIIREGAIVEQIDTTGTAAVTTLLVGTDDISTANTAPVVVTADGALTGTFTGAGKVLVTVLYSA